MVWVDSLQKPKKDFAVSATLTVGAPWHEAFSHSVSFRSQSSVSSMWVIFSR